MAVKFEVESVLKITGRGCFVIAKLIDKTKSFWLPENSRLGGVEIGESLTQPRATDGNGNIRTDLWAFQIKNEFDFDKINKGEIVELFPGNEIGFLPPWIQIESNGGLENELQKEISGNHILYGKKIKAIAKREDNDDVLFEISKEEMAVVHLTWKGKKETSPNYPKTRIFNDWTEVYEKVIISDNQEYELE